MVSQNIYVQMKNAKISKSYFVINNVQIKVLNIIFLEEFHRCHESIVLDENFYDLLNSN